MILLILILLVPFIATAAADEKASQDSTDWERRLEQLRSVPYVDLAETEATESQNGVVLYNREEYYEGYNLYCARSSGEAFLLDMNGRMVHRWSYLPIGGSGSYHHTIMLADGDLVVVKEYQKLLRLNWYSELIWERELAAHHDVVVAPDGTFFVIVQEEKIHRGLGVWFDALVHLTAAGEELDGWSTYGCLDEIKSVLDTRSFLDTVIDSAFHGQGQEDVKSQEGEIAAAHGRDKFLTFHLDLVGGRRQEKSTAAGDGDKDRSRYHYDYFHLNSVGIIPPTPLGKRDERFRPGNLLVCFRNVNQIAVLERGTYRVLWSWGEGQLDWPHHPTMLDNGHILIFDNGVQRGYSRVVELDPTTETIVWKFMAEPPEDFYSKYRGSAQRLPNGNTLICESDKGRVFEVTGEGEVVWSWLNPATGEGRRKILYRFLRVPSVEVDNLLTRWWWWE